MNVPRAAIDVMARTVLHFAAGSVGWEDYPDIGEHDWELIADRMAELAPMPDDAFEAWDLLIRRCEKGAP